MPCGFLVTLQELDQPNLMEAWDATDYWVQQVTAVRCRAAFGVSHRAAFGVSMIDCVLSCQGYAECQCHAASLVKGQQSGAAV